MRQRDSKHTLQILKIRRFRSFRPENNSPSFRHYFTHVLLLCSGMTSIFLLRVKCKRIFSENPGSLRICSASLNASLKTMFRPLFFLF